MCRTDDFSALGPHALQRIEPHRIDGQQVGEVDADWSGGAGTRRAQFMHLRGVEPSSEVNRASVSVLLYLNAAFHVSLLSKVGTIASWAVPAGCRGAAHHRW
jgi:hypothetical protein